MIRFNRDRLRPALILHVRSKSKLGRAIQEMQEIAYRRHCHANGFEYKKPWGNHDGLICPYPGTPNWFVGEALPAGSVKTPLEMYEADMSAGKLQCRVYEPIYATERQLRQVCANWTTYIFGTKYDYWAYPRLIIKTALMDWEQWPWPFSLVGRRAAGSKWDHWCTEGVNDAFGKWPPFLKIIDTKNPIPLHVEQVAGQLKRYHPCEVVLKDITSEAIIST